MQDSLLPIIYCHYGNVDYLEKTLLCASITNAHKRRILIGDKYNKYTALSSGWQHVNFSDIDSDKRREFNRNFKYIKGPKHPIRRNSGDWLRFVFERWYIIEEFAKQNGISKFWHFDSDVMIVEDLSQFEAELHKYDFTKQCNDTCLNGYVSTSVLTNFCFETIELFKNEAFIKKQQDEFNTVNKDFAFTEMRAFEIFSNRYQKKYHGIHLEAAIDGWWFDDFVLQDDGYEMTKDSINNKPIKKLMYRDKHFYCRRNINEVKFATINMSWVKIDLFEWILSNILTRKVKPSQQSTILDWQSRPPTLKNKKSKFKNLINVINKCYAFYKIKFKFKRD